MLRFLVQKINGHVYHDFAQGIVDAQEYHSWLNDPFIIKYANDHVPENLKHPERYVPVGTIDFVTEFVKLYFPEREEKILTPLNVPDELMHTILSGREVICVNSQNHLITLQEAFKNIGTEMILCPFYKNRDLDSGIIAGYKKSMYKIKAPSNGYFECSVNDFSSLNGCQVSSVIPDLLSEWRVFVYHNKPLYIANYSGDPLIFPDKTKIEMMISSFTQAPVAYTLDVYVSKAEEHTSVLPHTLLGNIEYPYRTGVMECHNFFSCGLYGFRDWQKYPYMLSQAWYQMLFDFKVE